MAATGTLSGSPERKNLGQQFEDDYAEHLARAGHKKQLGYGFIGAGAAGVLGAVALPVMLLPGVAAAAIAGGAGGSIVAKVVGGKAKGQAGERPNQRRLRFLAKWGYWQLLQFEGGSADQRGEVLDEVVRAFSPWVQRAFLLGAQRNGQELAEDIGEFTSETAEGREVILHLAPLWNVLHRSAVVQAVEDVAEAVGNMALIGALQEKHVFRCRMVFPTIVQTIVLCSREGGFLGKMGPIRRCHRIVAAIKNTLERPDVIQSLSAWHGPTRPVEGALGSARPGGHSPNADVECPPAGAEDEPGDIDVPQSDVSDGDFFSCGEEEDGGSAPSAGPSSRPAALSAGGATASYARRCAALPQGDVDHSWDVGDCTFWQIRGASYLTDRKKVTAPEDAMLQLAGVDFFRMPSSGALQDVGRQRDMCHQRMRAGGDRRFHFILNFILPPFQIVIVSGLCPSARWPTVDGPQRRLWERFLAASDEVRRKTIKIIMHVEEGPWLARKTVPQKPIILGTKVKTNFTHTPGESFEVEFDVASSPKDQKIVSFVMKAMKHITFKFSIILEGKQEDELPEAVLFTGRARKVDTESLLVPG